MELGMKDSGLLRYFFSDCAIERSVKADMAGLMVAWQMHQSISLLVTGRTFSRCGGWSYWCCWDWSGSSGCWNALVGVTAE